MESHDTSTAHHSGTNGVVERAVCRVTEGNSYRSRAKRDHQKNGGTVRWNAHVTCAPCRTRWQMTRQHSRRYIARGLTDHQFFSEYWLRWSHFPRKDKSRAHHFGRKSLNGNILGLCSTCGRRLVRRFDDGRLWMYARIRSLRNSGEKIQKLRCIRKRENEFPCAGKPRAGRWCWNRRRATKREETKKIRRPWVANFFVDIMKDLVWSFTTQTVKHSRSDWSNETNSDEYEQWKIPDLAFKTSWRIQVGEMEDLRKSRILPDLTVSGLEFV